MRRRNTIVATVVAVFAAVPLLAGGVAAEETVVEAEASAGTLPVMTRSAAFGQRTVWLQANETLQMPFSVVSGGTYSFGLRYSNDNWGSMETVDLLVDGSAAGQFTTQDTGNWGGGWNTFIWSPALGPRALVPGDHQASVRVTGGDGYGVEIDVLTVELLAPTVQGEAELGTGDGVVQPRSAASGQRTVWLRAGQTRVVPVQVSGGSYALAARYSNDNWGSLETVALNVDGMTVGRFTAQDTGDAGAGWNVFVSSGPVGTVSLAAGSHEVSATVSGGDGYGVEIDVMALSLVP